MDAAKNEKKKSYSDLEAIVTSDFGTRRSYWDAKFAVPNTPQQFHSAAGPGVPRAVRRFDSVRDAQGYLGTSSPVDTPAPGPPAYYLVDANGQTQVLYTVPSSTLSETSSVANFKGGVGGGGGGSPVSTRGLASPVSPAEAGGWWAALGAGPRTCGLRKNVWLALLAGACALALGLLATVLVVTHPRWGGAGGGGAHRADNGSAPFATPALLQQDDAGGGAVLAASDLAACNWTLSGQAYTAVFYQAARARGAGLMAAIKADGAAGGWATVNISAAVAAKGAPPLDVLPGTPLAVATNRGLWNLYYLTSRRTIAELYSTDPLDPASWQPGDFGAKLGSPEAAPGSGLGAMWQECEQCDNGLFVAWQNAQSNTLVYAIMVNFTWGSPTQIDATAMPGTPVSVNAFTDSGSSPAFRGQSSKNGDRNAARFYYTVGDRLKEMLRGPLGRFKLIGGNNNMPLQNGLSVSPPPKMASLSYAADGGQRGWINTLVAWIDPFKGQMKAINYLDGGGWHVADPSLEESPPDLVESGFSTLAMTQTMKIYLLSPHKGEIHEYQASPASATRWIWQESVKLGK